MASLIDPHDYVMIMMILFLVLNIILMETLNPMNYIHRILMDWSGRIALIMFVVLLFMGVVHGNS